MSILRYACLISFAALSACTVDLSPYLGKSFSVSQREVGAHPLILDYSLKTFNQVFAEFIPGKELETLADSFETWHSEFMNSEWADPWRSAGYKFGIFGCARATHKKERLIKGTNCKMCYEFIDWIRKHKKISPMMERLLLRLEEIDRVAQKEFFAALDNVGEIAYPWNGQHRLPVTVRIIRFERSDSYALPLHFDISILSLIFPSNDEQGFENLVLAPADGRPFQINDLRRALRPTITDPEKTCGLLIAGSQIKELAPHINPSPHGVLPHGRGSRCVIVACLHLPYCDTSLKSALLPSLNQIPSHLLDPIREMEKVPPGALIVLDVGGTLLIEESGEWVLTDKRWPIATNRAEKVIALTQKPPTEEISLARQKTLYENGISCKIIEATTPLKGQRLASYIESLEQKPTMVLYVDDSKEQIESVHQVCRELGIPCQSIHYQSSFL